MTPEDVGSKTVELRKPADWMSILSPDREIHNYDGWLDQSFDTPVTREDFQRRLGACTMMPRDRA